MRYDLGNGVTACTTQWAPDRVLNPQLADTPDIDPCGLIITHEDGCKSSLLFDLPGIRQLEPTRDLWQLISLDPLHIEPSVMRSGTKNGADHDHHGFIRNGEWVNA